MIRQCVLFCAPALILALLMQGVVVQSLVAQEPSTIAPQEQLGADVGAKIAKETQISAELLRRIQQSKAALESIVIVDARSQAETSVSMIPGAITKAQYEADLSKYAGKTAVCYCLSGGRSGKLVKQLKEKNIAAVDLKGSIRGWCEAGYPLTTPDGKPTNRVNVYGNKVPPQYESVE